MKDPMIPDVHGTAWAEVPARCVHHAAFAAWVHRPTGMHLVKWWIAHDYVLDRGQWLFTVRGREIERPEFENGPGLFERAEAAIRELIEEVQQHREK